jgi:hypothetical protein
MFSLVVSAMGRGGQAMTPQSKNGFEILATRPFGLSSWLSGLAPVMVFIFHLP